MNIVRFQGENPSVYYEFDKDSSPLGEGGMGRVYQGFRVDTALNFQSVVAIKCIKPELVSNPTVIQRAQREASVRLDHTNLIRMYGFFSGAEYNQFTGGYVPCYYIAMERLIGVNLDEILFKGIVTDRSGLVVPIADELKQSYEADRESASISVMRSVLAGVGFLHQYGFIHRDLDPSNVMLTQEGATKVIDFGICKRIGMSSYGGAGLTQAGQFLGKVAYAAPELILGDLKSQGPATDIYALGIMLYQLIMGALPVDGSDQEVMDIHLKGKLDFSGIQNKRLRKIIEKATQKDPYKRYASAAEFSADLSELEFSGKRTVSSSQYPSPAAVSFEPERRSALRSLPAYLIPASCAAGLFAGIIASFIF